MYSTLDDLKKIIPEETIVYLTDDGAIGTIDEPIIAETIAQADAVIDGYCGRRYKTPLNPVSDLVKKLSVDIAVYNLYCRRVEAMPDVWAERYKNAIRQLEGIAKGTIALSPEQGGPAAPAETNKETDGNTFSREKLSGY